jgi:hypothetical protein
MKLTKIAILALRGFDRGIKGRIAEAAGGVTVSTLNRWIADNDDNLTKAAVVKIIGKETGLTDQEILEEDTVEATK